MALVLDGNGTMTVGNGDITGLSTGALPSTVIGSGAVLQVAYAQNLAVTSNQQTSSSTYINITGMSVTISPLSSSSRLFVFSKLMVYVTGGSSPWMSLAIAQDGTNVSTSTYGQGYMQGDAYVGNIVSLAAFVNAGSTSSRTFTTQMKLGGGGASTCQTDNGDQVMFVMEIAG